MPVQIKVDQSGKPPGVAGQAREDLATGTAVTLTAVGGPFLSYQWRIVSKPINILTPVRSSALLATPASVVTLLNPIDVPGTHLLEVAVDSGNGLGAGEDDIARITFYAGPTLNANPLKIPRRQPAAFEGAEHNVPDALDPAGNPDGWAREMLRQKAILDQLAPYVTWASGRISTSGGIPSLVYGNNIGTPGPLGTGMYRIPFITPAANTNYGVLATAASATPGFGPPTTGAVASPFGFTVGYFDVSVWDNAGGALSDEFDITFRVELNF